MEFFGQGEKFEPSFRESSELNLNMSNLNKLDLGDEAVTIKMLKKNGGGSLTGNLVTLTLALVLCLWVWGVWSSRRRALVKNFPPGPRSSLGFLVTFRHFLLTTNVNFLPNVDFYDESRSKILGVSTSLLKGIFISNLPDLKEVFNNPGVLSRPPLDLGKMFDDEIHRGIALSSGETWREIRKFTVSQLKQNGIGQKRLEPMITEDAEELVSILRTKVDQPFSTKHFFDLSAFNVLWKIIAGRRLGLDDPMARTLLYYIEKTNSGWLEFTILSSFPRLGWWVLSRLGQNPFLGHRNNFYKFTKKLIKQRLADREAQHEDFAGAFMEKIKSTTDVNSPFYGQLGYENLQATIRDLFVAGTETTGTTMSWTLLYLALHPEKQEKLHREIDSVIQGRSPTLEDKYRMPYTEAVISETLRKSSNAPLMIPHINAEELTVGQFTVPKGTSIYGNSYAIHHSKDIWGDPYAFRPERFLSEDERTVIKHEALIPFGVGKRSCPGEALAKQQLFLFTTNIFREFSVTWNPNEPKPHMGAEFGLTLMPITHTLIITERRKKFDS